MRVAVMGAGAVGGYFGAKLARAGPEVWFIARGERLKAYRTTGIRVESIDGDFEIVPVRAIRDPSSIGKVDLVLFTVKSTGTDRAAEEAVPMVGPYTTVLSVQNGVDNEAVLERVLGADRIVPGVAVIGVAMPEPGLIRHTNNGSITLGEVSGEETDRVRSICKAFADAGVDTKVTQDVRTVKWRKLIWNASFNPIAALTGMRVLEIIEDDASRSVAEVAMREAIEVGEALGHKVGDYQIERATQRNPNWARSRTSMLQDMERGRPTEIDALTGAVIRYGREKGVQTPVMETLYRLVRAKELAMGNIDKTH
ncbi:MAG: 2-dehydropantoate 2-reductase [Thermoplasmata archaeon]|nr:MAG: 2-dehydropantoate 2-reductase [Thermoplasmata archaeon]